MAKINIPIMDDKKEEALEVFIAVLTTSGESLNSVTVIILDFDGKLCLLQNVIHVPFM